MFNLFSQKCSNCGKDVPGGASFCPYCGTLVKGGKVKCGNCGAENAGDATFCRQCGQKLAMNVPPTLVDNHWKRGGDDFATRLEVSDLRGFFAKDLIIEPGTRAMLIADGQNIGVVGPGRYTLQTLLDRIPILSTLIGTTKTMTAILADTGDVDLDFALTNLFTKDPLKIAVKCKTVVQLSNPVLFMTNLMKDQRAFPLRAIRDYLFDEVLDAAQEFVGQRGVDELSRNLALKQQMEVEMEAHLNRTLERTGLHLVQVRTLDYALERFDKVRQIREEYFLQISEEEAKNQNRRRLLDALKESWVQDLAEDTAKTEIYEQRAAVWERMRRAVMSDRMGEVKTEEEFTVFLQDVDKRKLIRAEEWENLKRDIAERRQDHDKLRGFLAAKADIEHEYGLKQAQLNLQSGLTRAQIDFELETERKRLEGRLNLDTLRWEAEIKRQQAEAEFRREQAGLDAIAARERAIEEAKAANAQRLGHAQTDAEIRALERDQDRLDGELGILLLEKMKTVKRVDERERMLMAVEQQKAQLELQLRAEQARAEIELQKARELHAQEIKRLETYALMSTESLIAATGVEQGKLLAELKRTEILKGMTEEQILAMAAEKSPQIAQAFVEKFRAMASPEQQKQLQEMYDRMLAEQKESVKSLREIQEENARRLQAMFEKALETQRETATAFARTSGQPPIVVTSGGGQPTVLSPGGLPTSSGQVMVCKRCHVPSPVGTKFCQNCGEAFF
jgi:ribosomal protein L40E